MRPVHWLVLCPAISIALGAAQRPASPAPTGLIVGQLKLESR